LGKDLSGVIVFLLLVVFLTYRSFSPTVFYVSWAAGAVATGFFLAAIILVGCISKTLLRAFWAAGAWFVVALMVSPYATDIVNHFKIWTVTFFYTVVSLAMVEIFLKSKIDFKNISFVFLLAWDLVNGVLLALFFVGIYVPLRGDFSGVFHDRNVFSITTLILIAFLMGGTYKVQLSPFWRTVQGGLTAFAFVMILISKSITGLMGTAFLFLVVLRNLRLATRLFALVVVGSAFILLFVVENPIKDRLDRFYLAASGQEDTLNQNESAYIRFYLLTEGFKLAREKWAFGVGLDNARLHVIWPLRGTGSFLHNTYLDIVTSGGVVMFLLYYLPIFGSLFWLMRKRRLIANMAPTDQRIWFISVLFLCLKVIYDMTWTTYFEFAMVFSVVFAIYSTQYLKRTAIR
jgi:hypothetical protein